MVLLNIVKLKNIDGKKFESSIRSHNKPLKYELLRKIKKSNQNLFTTKHFINNFFVKNTFIFGCYFNVKIYASSSSASLLKDKNAYLTGRQRVIEVMPLNFDEYLVFKNITIKKSDAYLIESYFEDYMSDGGMPEYVLTGDISYIQNLIDNIIYKDIIAYYNIKSESVIKDFYKLLMERSEK